MVKTMRSQRIAKGSTPLVFTMSNPQLVAQGERPQKHIACGGPANKRHSIPTRSINNYQAHSANLAVLNGKLGVMSAGTENPHLHKQP